MCLCVTVKLSYFISCLQALCSHTSWGLACPITSKLYSTCLCTSSCDTHCWTQTWAGGLVLWGRVVCASIALHLCQRGPASRKCTLLDFFFVFFFWIKYLLNTLHAKHFCVKCWKPLPRIFWYVLLVWEDTGFVNSWAVVTLSRRYGWRVRGQIVCGTWWWCTPVGDKTQRRTSYWESTLPAKTGRRKPLFCVCVCVLNVDWVTAKDTELSSESPTWSTRYT